MPPEGVELSPPQSLLSDDEVIRVLSSVDHFGVDKIRFTGGEPLLRQGLGTIVREAKGIGFQSLGVTTNGILLHRKLSELVDAGLDSVNISLDTLGLIVSVFCLD
jgi:cyclic pyranopterin phosphate synthase